MNSIHEPLFSIEAKNWEYGSQQFALFVALLRLGLHSGDEDDGIRDDRNRLLTKSNGLAIESVFGVWDRQIESLMRLTFRLINPAL